MAILETADEGDQERPLKLISKKGVKINKTDNWDWAALHMVVYGGWYEEMVRVLIEDGADLDARTFDNETPLELALMKGHAGLKRIIEEELMRKERIRQNSAS